QRFDESFHEAWDRYKDLLRACPHHDGNLLERSTQDVLMIIENKSKVRNSRSKPVASQVKACDVNSNSSEIAKLTHAVNQQTNAVTTAMTAILKQFQAAPPPAPVKAVEETCVTCGEFRDNIQEYVSAAAVNYNQGNPGYRPSGFANQIRPPGPGSLPSNTIANPKGELKAITTRSGLVIDGPTVPTPSRSINPKEDERVEETFTDPDLAEYTIKVPPPPAQKYKPPSQREFVVHKRDPLYSNIPYPSRMLKQKHELKCKALGNLCARINLMPLSVWKNLGLPKLIPTRMTLELANRAICTPVGIARDVFISVGKFTFPADFVIVDYESDPRVPLILGRPFLRTAHALIDVHGEETILRDEGCNVLSEKLLDFESTKDLHPPLHDNPLSGSTTYPLLEEFVDELPSEYDDNLQFDIEFDLKEIEFLLYQDKDSSLKDSIDQKNRANLADIFVDSAPEMFTDEHTLDYSSPLIFDIYDDEFLEVESDAENIYNDPFNSKGEKIKESKLLIYELDLPCDFHPPPEYDSFISQDFSRNDALPSTNNEDKIFNP
nr:reverse transcriptase domain-containing protein [Tanacetum cinerariifolium]